ncbi:GntR family transcriptional regulator [Aureimonas flava]|uniref:GntR family transcriptional regulator n=1 Tax=Aureimonas flava TaxID=2320271 RepID=UPI003CCACA42
MSAAPQGEAGDRRPTYERIAALLRGAVDAGRLPPGLVLSEVPLARLFGASRSPIRQALAQLEADGLVRRFDGRGLVVGDCAPNRAAVTPAMLGLSAGALGSIHERTADALYYRVERELILHSLRGAFRVSELALSRHLDVGRSVARDVLVRAQGAGLIDKGDNSRWTVVPLGPERIDQFYELRILLEPVALGQAAPRIPPDLLAAVAAGHREAGAAWPDLDAATLDRLETDLHVHCLDFATNPEIGEALRRSRMVMLSGKHVQRALGATAALDRFMDEHLEVIEALRLGRTAAAQDGLARHLASSRAKALERLAAFRRLPQPEPAPYIDA